jgi:hypothetical protein
MMTVQTRQVCKIYDAVYRIKQNLKSSSQQRFNIHMIQYEEMKYVFKDQTQPQVA